MRFLLIDDDESCLLTLRQFVEQAGYSCSCCQEPVSAVEQYQPAQYDIVITDFRMPGMDGLEVLTAIRAKHAQAIVILVTGYGNEEMAAEARELGAFAFLYKPLDAYQLYAVLERAQEFLEKKQAPDVLVIPKAEAWGHIEDEIDELFFTEASEMLEKAAKALVASERKGDPNEAVAEIFRAFHSIKGGSQSMGFSMLAEFAHRMEDLLDEVRKGKRSIDRRLASILLEAMDLMEKELICYANGDDVMLLADFQADVLRMVRGEAVTETAAPPAAAPSSTPAATDKAAPVTVAAGTGQLWFVQFDFEEDAMTSLRQLMVHYRLRELGTVLYTSPDGQALETGEVPEGTLRLFGLLESEKSAEEIRKHCDVDLLRSIHTVLLNGETTPAAEPETAAPRPPEPTEIKTNSAAKAIEAKEAKSSTSGAGMVRVDVEKLDSLIDYVGELVITEAALRSDEDFEQRLPEPVTRHLGHMGKTIRSVQDVALSMRMVSLAGTFQKMSRMVRDIAVKENKKVHLQVIGEDTEIDKTIIEQISDPLMHLIRNSIDHGIGAPEERVFSGKSEVGQIVLEARQESGEVIIMVRDDGRGLQRDKIIEKAVKVGLLPSKDVDIRDEDVWKLIFAPGFSTAEKVTDISGRGVGMDVVKRNIAKVRGRIEVRTAAGKGTAFFLHIPLTLAIIDGLIVRVGERRYVIPVSSVCQSFSPTPEQLVRLLEGEQAILLRGKMLPVISLDCFYSGTGLVDGAGKIFVVLQVEDERFCLVVDEIIGKQQVVIKKMPGCMQSVRGAGGCAIISDGSVAIILDTVGLVKHWQHAGEEEDAGHDETSTASG